MKKRNLMMVACLAALGLPLQAQVVATLGFEAGDEKFVHKDSVQFASFYADHINLYGGDVWDEKCTDAHSGAYALELNNSNVYRGNTWDRGLKLRYLDIEEETSYRVSFWVKANPTFTLESDPATELKTSIKSTLSIGRENLEAPLMSQSGTQYYYNWTDGIMTGGWRRLSFVAYNSGKAIQDNFFDKFDDNIKEIIVNDPDDPSKNDTIWWRGDDTSFPDTYFLTINMYNPGRYVLDDIMVEKATMAGCYYNYDFIKVDLGYPTNIAELAKASTDPRGILLLDNSCVKVTKGGEELEVLSVEGHDDGCLYIFMVESDALESGAEDVRVSFTPAADCPIVYNTDQRPSMDVESEMKVLGFADEAIWPDESLDEFPYTYLEPNMISSNPESGSFELDPATFDKVTVTYDRELDLSTTSAVLKDGNGTSTIDLSNDIYLSDDLTGIIVPVSNLANGEYTLTLSGVANIYGIPALDDQVITFAVGPDTDTSVSEVVYAPDFTQVENGTFPKGWVSNDNGTIHEYGLTDSGEVWNYNYGGNMGGGGPRMFTGFTGDFTQAIYWRLGGADAGTELGTLSYGEQVKDYILPEGGLDPEMDPEIALYLEPKKHEVSFRMAAWKGEPVFNFTLEDLDGNVVARFDNITAVPNVNGDTNANVQGSVEMRTDFTVPSAGYYMLKFSTNPGAAWTELLLANVRLITKPSDAAYNKQLLREACDSAAVVLGYVENAAYDGATKTALTAAVKEANETHYTSPTAISEMCGRLYSLCGDMLLRMKNVDDFDLAVVELQVAMSNYTGTKYVMADDYIAAEKLVADYADVSSATLDDATLNEVAPKLVRYAGLINNLSTCVDALTYRAFKAVQTARVLGTDAEGIITQAENAIDDDDDVVAAVNEANKWTIYKILGETGTIADELKTTIMSETEADDEGNLLVAASGVDFTGYIKNPHFYTFATNNAADATSESVPGWKFEGSVHLRDGDFIASETKPVVSSVLNGYRSEYTVSQSVSGLPVGVYDVFLRTRTAAGKNGVNDETGRPDKYLWVSTAEGDTVFTAFIEGSSWNGHPTVVKNVKVEENTVLTFGATEHYTSGKNVNDAGEDLGSWDTNTFVDEAHLFLVAPLAGFDYNGALTGVDEVKAAEALSYEYFTVDGMKLDRPVKGVNIVKIHRADGTTDVKKVVVK